MITFNGHFRQRIGILSATVLERLDRRTARETDAPLIRASEFPDVSENVPERPRANFVSALNVRRNAARGFAFSLIFTAGVMALFVLLPGTRRPTPYYVALAFVLALSLGALATAVLTLISAYRLAQEEDVG